MGLCQNMRKLIESCISTVSYKVLVNGEMTQEFKPSYGIRQGDPLSNLFVLAMEKFSQLINVVVDGGFWMKVSAFRGVWASRISFLLMI